MFRGLAHVLLGGTVLLAGCVISPLEFACDTGRECTCGDGSDTDNDALIDCADTDCDNTTREWVEACGTGTASCISGVLQSCTSAPTSESGSACFDGQDNDCDGLIDCDDTDAADCLVADRQCACSDNANQPRFDLCNGGQFTP